MYTYVQHLPVQAQVNTALIAMHLTHSVEQEAVDAADRSGDVLTAALVHAVVVRGHAHYLQSVLGHTDPVGRIQPALNNPRKHQMKTQEK